MVMPWLSRTAYASILLALGFASTGCGLVPRQRLDECRKLGETLRSENAQLKDQTLSLRAQNQELNLRAVDDARELKAQTEALDQLEQSVQAYQSERDKLARDFDLLKGQLASLQGQIRVSADPGRAVLIERLEAVAKTRPGVELNAMDPALLVPTDSIFEPGTDHVKPEASVWLEALATALASPEAGASTVRIVGASESTSGVERAGLGIHDHERAHFLGMARAAKVRSVLLASSRFEAGRVTVTSDQLIRTSGVAKVGDRTSAPGRVDIRLRPGAAVEAKSDQAAAGTSHSPASP